MTDGRPRVLTAMSKALHVGAIQTFAERDDRIWIGGLEGLAVVRDDRVLHLTVRDGPSFSQVTGIIETPGGDLWVRGVDDAWHVGADELRQALQDKRTEVEAEHFDALDGLDRIGLTRKSNMTLASDGLLWFGTNQGWPGSIRVVRGLSPARPSGASPPSRSMAGRRPRRRP